MIMMVAGRLHVTPVWRTYAERITEILSRGLTACKQKDKPKTEPDLQVLCDAILRGARIELDREYPFAKWAFAYTKPDWSSQELNLWIELKYVRKSSTPATITNDIAADITKYGDNAKRVLFVIYDPDNLVNERESLMASVEAHLDMFLRFLH